MSDFCSELSVLGRSWNVRQDPDEGQAIPQVSLGGYDISPEVIQIARRRGAIDVGAFLLPTLREFMPDPHVLADMEAAAIRFAAAVTARERIAVFGDYDVDGATSTTILLRYQRMLGLEEGLFYIPQRVEIPGRPGEGYGPNIPAFEALREQGTSLLVIADSGTGAMVQIARAREIGMDVIVLDHHEPNADGSLPDAIVVNPKLASNDGSLSYLCTAGLAFLFLVAVNRRLRTEGYFARTGTAEPRLQNLLGLVALGTVADVVPLIGLNRAYVHVGLSQMSLIPGLVALNAVVNEDRKRRADESGKKHTEVGYTVYGCGFVYGPCINAGGRIADTRQGTWLLSSDDADAVKVMAVELNRLNRERQQMQEEMVGDCISRVVDAGPDDDVLVIYDEAWHPGVVGLGASKVKDRFDRSAVVIGTGGKGSARSVEGFNLGKAFLEAFELGILLKGGGHGAAAGLTILPARVDEFRRFLRSRSLGTVRPPTRVDLSVPVGSLDLDTVREFEFLSPFGMGNSHPRVAFTGGVLDKVRVLKDKHLKAQLVSAHAQVDLIMFNCIGTPLADALIKFEGHFIDVLGEVSVNDWGTRMEIQIKPADIMIGAPASHLAMSRHHEPDTAAAPLEQVA